MLIKLMIAVMESVAWFRMAFVVNLLNSPHVDERTDLGLTVVWFHSRREVDNENVYRDELVPRKMVAFNSMKDDIPRYV